MNARCGTVLVVPVLLLLGCQSQTGSSTASPSEVWIDVRTPAEFNAGHLAGAINLPYDQINASISETLPSKQQVLHCYCRSGRRSGIAIQVLKKLGYEKAINEGGFQQLKARGMKTVEP